MSLSHSVLSLIAVADLLFSVLLSEASMTDASDNSDILTIQSQLLKEVSAEEIEDIKRKVEAIEVLAKEIGMKKIVVPDLYDKSVAFQLRKIRARLDRYE